LFIRSYVPAYTWKFQAYRIITTSIYFVKGIKMVGGQPEVAPLQVLYR
jgi:hypothetical protein